VLSEDTGANGSLKAQHFLSRGAPGVASAGGAGTGPTVSLIAGTDTSGLIQVLTGTAPAASTAVVIFTYNQSFGAAGQGRPVLTPGNALAAALSGTSQVVVDSAQNDQNSWRIMAGSVALAATSTYKWWYHVLQ
jgi:hypothetical protein